MKICFSAGLFTALLFSALPASASPTLIGDSVLGFLNTSELHGQGITTQFSSPAIVGPGVEFAGVMTDHLGQIWDISVDIGASSLTIGWTEVTRAGDGFIDMGPSPANFLGVHLGDLDFAPVLTIFMGAVLTNYACVSSGISCTLGPPSAGLIEIDNSPFSVDIFFNIMRSGETYTFDLVTRAPEPATFVLVAIGLMAMRVGGRQRAVR